MVCLTDSNGQDDSTPAIISIDDTILNSNHNIPKRKGEEQGRWATVHKTTTNLHIKSSSNGTTDTNQLNMTTLELSMSVIANLAHRAHNTRTTRMSAIKSLLFVDMRAFDLVRSHDGRRIQQTNEVDSSEYGLEKKRKELHYEFHVPGIGVGGILFCAVVEGT